MKLLISLSSGIYYYYKGEKDYHCKEGYILESELLSGKSIVKTNTGKDFLVLGATNHDMMQKIKRGPQIIIPKDIGYIISRSGLNKNSKVIEAGGGSGAATVILSNLVNNVLTYEIKENHLKVIESNLELFNISNVNLNLGDLSENIEGLDKDSYDFMLLDMPEPVKVLDKKVDCLVSGSYIVCYLPSITQILELSDFIENSNNKYYLEEVSEIIHRQWHVRGKIARPNHQKQTDHTAFLVFIRKV